MNDINRVLMLFAVSMLYSSNSISTRGGYGKSWKEKQVNGTYKCESLLGRKEIERELTDDDGRNLSTYIHMLMRGDHFSLFLGSQLEGSAGTSSGACLHISRLNGQASIAEG